jgi:hypothetical protein
MEAAWGVDLMNKLFKWLFRRGETELVQNLVPKSRIEKMKNRVFLSPDWMIQRFVD